MAAPLLRVLERTEITKLPKAVQNKLEKFLSDQQYEIDSLKSHQEQFRVDSGKARLCSLFIQTAH
jgi:hypothetical protein